MARSIVILGLMFTFSNSLIAQQELNEGLYVEALAQLFNKMHLLDSMNQSFDQLSEFCKVVEDSENLFVFDSDSPSAQECVNHNRLRTRIINDKWIDSIGLDRNFMFGLQELKVNVSGVILLQTSNGKKDWIKLQGGEIWESCKNHSKPFGQIVLPDRYSRFVNDNYIRIHRTGKKDWGLVNYTKDNRESPSFIFSITKRSKWISMVKVEIGNEVYKVQFVGRKSRIKYYQIYQGTSYLGAKKLRVKSRISKWW